MFDGFLKLRTSCPACNADFSAADAGDGPAFFVMFLVLILVVPAAMVVELTLHPPTWVHMIVWPPVILGLSIWLLRPFKATLFALQWRHNAGEARFASPNDPE